MIGAIAFLASQALAYNPAAGPVLQQHGTWARANATAEVLPSATTRDEHEPRARQRHRRIGRDGEVILEFE